MDYGYVLHFAFSWRKTRQFAKYVGLVWLLHLLFFLSLACLAYLLFKDILLSLFSGSYSTFAALLLQPQLVGEMIITIFFAAIPLYLVFLLLIFFAQALIILFALKKADLDTIPLDLRRLFVLFFLAILTPFVALLSWFNRRMLLLPLFAVIFSFATFVPNEVVSIGSAILAIVLLLGYLVVVLYNYLRLSFAGVIFLSRDDSLSVVLEESWELTHNKIWSVILAALAVVLAVVIASFIAGFFLSVLFSIPLFIYLIPNFLLAFNTAIAFSNVFLHPFQLLCYSFAGVAIYEQLLEEIP